MTEKNILKELIINTKRTEIKCKQFFLSWSGVMTLAYNGFSNVILDLKEQVNRKFPGLSKEFSGSKWPKTTLGALNEGKNLDIEDVIKIKEICNNFDPKILNNKFEIDNLSVVLFYCRSLEKRISTIEIPLKNPQDSSGPRQNHILKVKNTHSQFETKNLQNYLPLLQKGGKQRNYYRMPYIESTLVHELKEVPRLIDEFRNEIDQALPGKYFWFSDQSLHITIRALY